MAVPSPAESHVAGLPRRCPLREHVPFLGVRRPAPGRVGEGLHHSPIRHSRLVGGRDDPANPVEMTPLAPVARIRIEPENVGCAYPFRDLLESRSTRIRVNDKDRRLARTEGVYELRACSMLCRRRRARVRIGLVGDVEPKDLSIASHPLYFASKLVIGDLPPASGIVVNAEPHQAARPAREPVGSPLRADVEEVPAIGRDERRARARVDHVPMPWRLASLGRRRRTTAQGLAGCGAEGDDHVPDQHSSCEEGN